jgi:hypothetical protein
MYVCHDATHLQFRTRFSIHNCAWDYTQMISGNRPAADSIVLGMKDNSILPVNAAATTGANAVTVETREFSHLLTSQTLR